MRVHDGLSYRAIAGRLNEDLMTNPPPEPVDPARALGRWSPASIRDILINPKYTGYMVWNRRATKDKQHPGKSHPRDEWVISSRPEHPAFVPVELFLAAQPAPRRRERARVDRDPMAPAPPTDDVSLLDHLPLMEIDLNQLAANRLRRFLDAFPVEIHYDPRIRRATLQAEISADLIEQLRQVAHWGGRPIAEARKMMMTRPLNRSCTVLGCAPGGSRRTGERVDGELVIVGAWPLPDAAR
jgi:hypothetical protein